MTDFAVTFQNTLPFNAFRIFQQKRIGNGGIADRTVENGFRAVFGDKRIDSFKHGGLHHRRHDKNASCECFSWRGQEVGRGNDRVEREAQIDGGDDLMVAEKDFIQLRAVIDGVVVFIERIDPDKRACLVWLSTFSVKEMRNAFLRNLIGHVSVGIVDGEEIELRRRFGLALRVEAANGHREIDVVWHAVVAIKPRRVQPPWVMSVVAERKAFSRRKFRNVRHPADQFQSEVVVQCGPWRIRRDFQIRDVFVDFTDRNGVGSQINACREIRSTRFDAVIRTFATEIIPELEDQITRLMGVLRIETVAVENSTCHAPCLRAETETIGEPDEIETDVRHKALGLFADERAEMFALRDAVRIGGVMEIIGVQCAVAIDENLGAQHVAECFGMTLVFEMRDGEFGPWIKRCSNFQNAATHFLIDGFQNGDEPLEVTIRPDRRVRHEQVVALVEVLEFYWRVGILMRPEIRAADIAGVFKSVVHISRIIKEFRTISRPEHQLELFAVEKIFPLMEDFTGGRGETIVGHVEAKRLQGDFQRYFFQ